MNMLQQSHAARGSHYPASTMKEKTTREIVALNLRRLMLIHADMSQTQLSKLSGVSQTYISAMLRAATEPTTKQLDKIGKVFKLKAWQIQMPNLPDDLLASDLLDKTVKALAEITTKQGREYVVETAVREAHFSKNKTEGLPD
jgi:transcriptional regulator with XRE-family HTH domain